MQTNLLEATWIDVNTNFQLNELPDRITDNLAIVRSSLYNLFNCVPGQRGRTFQPTYGSSWLYFLQEPISAMTARKIEMLVFQDIVKWEPRIQIDHTSTYIQPDFSIPGYRIRIGLIFPNLPGVIPSIEFEVQV